MGFYVVQGSPQTIWCRVDTNDVLYVGQIVTSQSDGVLPMAAAAGKADSSGKDVPFGVIIGTNNKTPLYDTTYDAEYITGVVTQAALSARDSGLMEGVTQKNDPSAMVEVALIDPSTYLSGPLYNNAFGTAPTVQTISSAQSDGMITAETWSASDVSAFTVDESTIHMRTGLNQGLQRIGVNTSQTAPAVTHAFPYDNTTADTGIQVPVREIGTAKIIFDSESTYIDISVFASSTKYYVVEIIKLDLKVSGKERCIFRFGADHFALLRA